MENDRFSLRLILEERFGKSYEVVMPLDTYDAVDKYVTLVPPSAFDGRTFEKTIDVIEKRNRRTEDFTRVANLLGKKLAERMEDEEGWHGSSRQEHYEALRR